MYFIMRVLYTVVSARDWSTVILRYVFLCAVLRRVRWSSVHSLAEWQPVSRTDKPAAGKLMYVTLHTRLDHPPCLI